VRGAQVGNQSVDLVGWVLGRQHPAVAVEVVHEGVVLRRAALNFSRPDVAAAFPHVPSADRSGFQTTVSLPTIKPDLELLVQAVLQDQSRVPLGVIHTRLCWREGTTASDVPLISVIIPSYNHAHFLTEAIESILSQTYSHYEIVVVDDGSTDNTAEVAGRYPGVRCVRQDNRGLAAARNTGIRKSSGDYLVFLDADDRLLPRALEVGLACLRAHPECAFVAGRCARIRSDGQPIPTTENAPLDGDPYSCLLSGCPVLVPAVMYRRATFQAFPGFDTSLSAAEDYHLYYRIARELPIYFHDVVVAEVRQHHANMTSNTAVMLRANLTALKTQWRYVKANPQYKEAYRAGLRFWRKHYGGRLAVTLPNQFRLGQWKRALSEMILLLRYYPQGLAAVFRDQFALWKYVSRVPPRTDDGSKKSDAADNGNFAPRLTADSPAFRLSPVGPIPLLGKARFGDLRRVTPISSKWGIDRGRPIDRYYIENFLAQHASTIRGRVLEIGDNSYTKAFGGDRVVVSDVLHVTEGNPMATIVGDLTRADHIPSDSFDCIILTQTLQLMYDTRAAIETLHRILKPDGVLLATFPGITHTARDEWAASWYWHFTTLSARRLFEEVFPPSQVQVECHGNVLASAAFLYGLAVDELDRAELDYRDPDYELLITVKAVRATSAEAVLPVYGDESVTISSKTSASSSSLSPPADLSAISGGDGAGDTYPRTLILLYHRVTQAMTDPWSLCVTSAHFSEHVETLQRHARIMHLHELVDGLDKHALPDRSVVITFDDGYADNLHNAKRVLERYDAQATVFIATGNTGHSEFWWDILGRLFLCPGKLPESLHLTISGCASRWELGEAAYCDDAAFWRHRHWRAQDDPPTPRQEIYRILWERLVLLADGERRRVLDELLAWAGVDPLGRSTDRCLSVEEIRNLASGGLVDIGAHTVTHSALAVLPAASQWDEITESKIRLEEILGRPVSWFAYPYGSAGTYTEESVGLVRQAGFVGACTTSSGAVNLRADRFQLPRVHVCDWDGDEFAQRLSKLVPGFL
jgi:glycosyltransferase involved in cell wall biosynthesis/peptidoglycan/xylan/chitin deacetylase (PgdA/CDA1 family)/SAM-dependent methyltransferase